eukprot:10298473-Karenia_brevis.AAC.1
MAVEGMNFSAIDLSPHILRHSGPSNDRYRGRASLKEIQNRGRWKTYKSVARYEKHARLVKQLSVLSIDQQRQCRSAELRLQKALAGVLNQVTQIPIWSEKEIHVDEWNGVGEERPAP